MNQIERLKSDGAVRALTDQAKSNLEEAIRYFSNPTYDRLAKALNQLDAAKPMVVEAHRLRGKETS